MKQKLFILLTMLIFGFGSTWAGYVPKKRVTTFESGKTYMIYNTCYNGTEKRTGFLYWSGGMKKKTSYNPHEFVTNNTSYLWKVTIGENHHIALQNVSTQKYIGSGLGQNDSDPNNLYIYQWGELSAKQSGVNSQNEADPSTRTANADITFESNKVFILGNGTDTFWNGNPGDIVTWGSGHPFAFYEVEEVDDVFGDGSAYKWDQNSFSTASEVPASASSATGVNQGYLRFDATDSVTCTFLYSTGNHRLDIYGVDILDTDGNVIASDYHHGYTGGNKENNVYTLRIPSGKAGTHLVRYFVGKPSNTTNGNITWSCSTAIGAKIASGKTATVEDNVHELYTSIRNFAGSGNIVLNKDETISSNRITTGTGKLTINEGKTLTLGSGDTQTNSIASFTSIELSGTIVHNNSLATLNNLTVPTGKTGKIFALDMGGDADGFKLAGTTTLDGNLTVCNKWNFQMKVDELAGSGTWLICGTDDDAFNAEETASIEKAIINVAAATTFTGTINLNNVPTDKHPGTNTSQVTVQGNLVGCTLKKTTGDYFYYSGNNLNGTTLDGVILAGSERLNLSNTVTIKNLAGNNLSASTNSYAIATSHAAHLVLEGTCDFKHKADNSETTYYNLSIGNTGGSITVKSGASVSCGKIWWSDDKSNAPITVESGATLTSSGAINASTITNNGTVTATGRLYANTITNNGTITALKLQGNAVLGDGTTTLSDSEGITKAITVNGDATLNLSAANTVLAGDITVNSGKTLTIDGASTAAITLNSIDRSMADYTFTNCTSVVVQFTETGAEYAAGGFTITNIPSDVTVKVKKYGTTEYTTETPVDGTVTISHSVGVSGSAAWLDYTFNLSTIESNTHDPADNVIDNAGNAGTTEENLTLDTDYYTNNSYNEDGTLKVMATPYRRITWPTNYTVAVAGNVPDVENGCLVAFGSKTQGSQKYLAIIRGASQNEIKLVKGSGNNAFEVISTMTAANATALSHLVVFTKNGNTFTVYLDGVQKTQVTYSEALGDGLQVGSLHGGITGTGLVRVDKMSDATAKAKVFAKTIRVYDYVISADQMGLLTDEFPYTSYGGTYSRTITTNSNLSATNAWLNEGNHGNVNVPVNATVDEVTYYPDVEITTTAASTLTVNADMDAENITFDGAGKLSIASDGTHNIHIYGSVTANGPISVKYGEIDLKAVPVTIGESGSVEFDFSASASDFSDVTTSTDYPITGNTSDYGDKVTGVYPVDTYHTYTITHNSTNNRYYLTVGPSVALKQKQAMDFVEPYYDNRCLGTGPGKYTVSLGETSYTDYVNFGKAVMSWETLGDCVEPTIAINQPTTGKFYRIQGATSEKYLAAGLASNDKFNMTTATDATTIFYYDSNNKLTNLSSGLCNGVTTSTWAWVVGESASTVTFKDGITYGGYAIQTDEAHFYDDGDNSYSSADRGGSISNMSGENTRYRSWYLTEVTTLPITISAAKFATLYSPVALTIPTGVTAYVATDHETYLHLDAIEGGIIPAETGVLLYADVNVATTYDFEITTDDGTAVSELTGTVAAISRPANSYILATGTSGVAFYKDGATTIPGFKAYLAASTGGTRTFHFGDLTAVKAIEAAQNPGKVVYDMNGRRVENPAKGLYIVNGKKVFINKK